MFGHDVAWAYANERGSVVRMQCVCGWDTTIHNDPRYDSDPIEATKSHLAAAGLDHWKGMLAEAEALPPGRVRDEAISRYRRDVDWSQLQLVDGWLTGRPDHVVPWSER